MKIHFFSNDGKKKTLTMKEVHQYLSEKAIQEAIEAKKSDPYEEVSYITSIGLVVFE